MIMNKKEKNYSMDTGLKKKRNVAEDNSSNHTFSSLRLIYELCILLLVIFLIVIGLPLLSH